MSLQKPRKSYERKKREVTDGKFESGKQAGRPTRSPGEAVRSISVALTPTQISDVRLLARIHFRGSMSACISQLIDSKLQVFEQELEAEWEKKNAARPHTDLTVKKPKVSKSVSEGDNDLGFVVVE